MVQYGKGLHRYVCGSQKNLQVKIIVFVFSVDEMKRSDIQIIMIGFQTNVANKESVMAYSVGLTPWMH